MNTKTASKASPIHKEWTIESTAYFGAGLDEMAAVLSILISNVSEYSKGDGRASDEALTLANQQLLAACQALENRSYEYSLSTRVYVGELSRHLMWARSLLEIVNGMFQTDSWEISMGDKTLVGYFGAVKRHIESAQVDVSTMLAKEVA